MALYHFSVRNVSRGKGQMVVASVQIPAHLTTHSAKS